MIALAWPLVTLAIALIFRRDVTQALGRMGRFKYHDLEVTFRQDLRQAEELARKLPPASQSAKADDSVILELHPGQNQPLIRRFSDVDSGGKQRQSLLKLAEQSPRQAIETAWAHVGETLDLVGAHRISPEESQLVALLRSLKIRVATIDHEPPTPDEARRFVELACPLISRIKSQR